MTNWVYYVSEEVARYFLISDIFRQWCRRLFWCCGARINHTNYIIFKYKFLRNKQENFNKLNKMVRVGHIWRYHTFTSSNFSEHITHLSSSLSFTPGPTYRPAVRIVKLCFLHIKIIRVLSYIHWQIHLHSLLWWKHTIYVYISLCGEFAVHRVLTLWEPKIYTLVSSAWSATCNLLTPHRHRITSVFLSRWL